MLNAICHLQGAQWWIKGYKIYISLAIMIKLHKEQLLLLKAFQSGHITLSLSYQELITSSQFNKSPGDFYYTFLTDKMLV